MKRAPAASVETDNQELLNDIAFNIGLCFGITIRDWSFWNI